MGQEEEAVGTHRKAIFPAQTKESLLLELALAVLESDVLLVQLPAKLQAASLHFLQVQPCLVPLPADLLHLDPAGTASKALRDTPRTSHRGPPHSSLPYLRHWSLYA